MEFMRADETTRAAAILTVADERVSTPCAGKAGAHLAAAGAQLQRPPQRPPPQPRARPPRPTFCRSARQHLLEIFCRDTRHLHNSTVTILVWDYFDQPGKRAEHHVSFAVQGLERGATNSAPVWCLPLLAEHPRRTATHGKHRSASSTCSQHLLEELQLGAAALVGQLVLVTEAQEVTARQHLHVVYYARTIQLIGSLQALVHSPFTGAAIPGLACAAAGEKPHQQTCRRRALCCEVDPGAALCASTAAFCEDTGCIAPEFGGEGKAMSDACSCRWPRPLLIALSEVRHA